MYRVLFVDDEKRVLSGLKRALRHKRDEWEMIFVSSGFDALDMITNEPIDVVVSDARMPDMDGIELLDRISKQAPSTIRIMLSGQAEQERFMKSANLAHFFLTKPTETDTLVSVIERMKSTREKVDPSKLDLLMSLRSIPSLPTVYSQLVMEINSEMSTSKSIAAIIEKDIGLTGKILKLVNSSFYGLRSKVNSVTFAISLLGSNTVKSFVLFYKLNNAYETLRIPELNITELWKLSEQVSIVAAAIAKEDGAPKLVLDDVMVAGLLQSLGILILASHSSRTYETVIQKVGGDPDASLVNEERRNLGISHLDVGGYILDIWGLPESICDAVRYCQHPEESDHELTDSTLYLHAAICLVAEQVDSVVFRGVTKNEALLEMRGKLSKWPDWLQIAEDIIKLG